MAEEYDANDGNLFGDFIGVTLRPLVLAPVPLQHLAPAPAPVPAAFVKPTSDDDDETWTPSYPPKKMTKIGVTHSIPSKQLLC